MITKKKLLYRAFGLNILSEIPLPELQCIKREEEKLEVIIELSDLTQQWKKHVSGKEHIIVRDDSVMIRIPNSAIFSIELGSKITVSPLDDYNEDQLRLYLLGTCMGVLLMQRNVLPLHGSAVAVNGRVYAFVGDSGAGKSTLASAFLKKGYHLLSDDIVPITFSNKGFPLVTPSYPQQKLWKESLDQFAMKSTQFRPIYQRETKFSVPIESNYFSQQLPLAGVYELVTTNSQNIELLKIEKIQKLRTLLLHTYRNFIIPELGLLEWHFEACSKIINNIKLYQIQRPISGFTAHKMVDLILSSLDGEDKE